MTSLLQLVEELVRDPVAKTAYAADPDVYLDRHGFGDLDAEDIAEALSHVADSFPPLLAAQLTPQTPKTSPAWPTPAQPANRPSATGHNNHPGEREVLCVGWD